MNDSEKEMDDLIHQALTKEEAAYYDQLGEQNMPQMILGLFKGKNSWITVVMFVFNLVVLGLSIYTFVEMLNTDVIVDKLEWAFYTLIGFITMSLLKIYNWNQMDKNAMLREIKRLEFQVSLLGKKS
ncbi:DUF6768 family protein [Roseivirga sp.]|uniref:DUF6768 family protein n=1 Tax=Roseivirga sp. TaxID=1964215 RepID=UPI002B274F0E|nr:DUF6768 family protein [Roseivirga sp.]